MIKPSKCNNKMRGSAQLATLLLVAASYLAAKTETSQASYLATTQQVSPSLMVQQPFEQPLAPTITPFAFSANVQEKQRASVLCTISSGEVPVTFNWLKDGQLLSPSIAEAKNITIKPDSDQSTLKFGPVRLDHAGNYTCVAKNRIGIQAHSAQLVVHGEPRWLREPQREPIVATRGQTIVIDCQTTGWPKPQQSWLIKSK